MLYSGIFRPTLKMLSQRGQVRCGKIVHFRAPKGEDKTHPKIPGFTNINATSGNKTWKGLSPMVLGPFQVIERRFPTRDYPDGVHPGFVAVNEQLQGAVSYNLENWWQYSKLYDVDGPFDLNYGNLPRTFLLRRAQGLGDPKPHRRALPKAKGTPVASYFDARVFSYIPSRKFYCTVYEALVIRTPEYQNLLQRLANGENLLVIGYDGFDLPITNEAVQQAYDDPSRPFGHELVLFTMLNGLRQPWIESVVPSVIR